MEFGHLKKTYNRGCKGCEVIGYILGTVGVNNWRYMEVLNYEGF